MRRRLFVVLGILSVLLPAMSAGQDRVFRAGAAIADITPRKFPVSMTGSFTDRQATAAHDPLTARCLVLDDGQTRIALVVCDSCLIPSDIFDMAKKAAAAKTGIPTDHMLMSATHTHTAPPAYAMAPVKPDPEYLVYLAGQIAVAVDQANQRLAPAQVGWGSVNVPDQVFNRRWKMKPGKIPPSPFGDTSDQVRTNPGVLNPDVLEPAGKTDPEVSFLSVRSPAGVPIALLASYSLHYVGGIPAGMVSADYFGEFARQLAARVDSSSFVGILANGTSGDINNVNVQAPAPRVAPFAKIEEVAKRVSDAVYEASQQATHHPWVPLGMAEREIELEIRRPNEQQRTRAQSLLQSAEAEQIATIPRVYAEEAIVMSKLPATFSMKLQAIRIGELGIAAEPCEAFAEIGLEIKRRSPLQPTFVIGLANGYGGYLPTPRQHDLGGYETWPSRWSFLEREASEQIVDALVELLAETKSHE